VIVPAVKKNAAALNKNRIIIETSSPTLVGFFVYGIKGKLEGCIRIKI
jgi:hypothetical protein